MKLTDKINEVFKDKDSDDFIKENLAVFRENINKIGGRIQNTIFILLMLIAGFELLNRGLVKEIVWTGFKITDLTLVYQSIPVFIAYYFYVLGSLIIQGSHLKVLHNEILKKHYNLIYKNDLDCYFFVDLPMSIEGILTNNERGCISNLISLTSVIIAGIISHLGPIVFEIYALYNLFSKLGNNPINWIVLFFSGVFIFRSFLMLIQAIKLEENI